MAQYFSVIGGEYTDTTFSKIVDGGSEHRFGPFDAYGEARVVWLAKEMESIDDVYVRYSVKKKL